MVFDKSQGEKTLLRVVQHISVIFKNQHTLAYIVQFVSISNFLNFSSSNQIL